MKKTIVVDIDGTITSGKGHETAGIVRKEAVGILNILSKVYRMVYLTGRDKAIKNETIDLLLKNGLPDGFDITLDMMEEPWKQYREYLLSKLERLKKYDDVVLVIDNDKEFLGIAKSATFNCYLITDSNDWNIDKIKEKINSNYGVG